MAYDLGSGLGGHITLATDYMVYYPSNGGAIEVHMTPVDKSDTRYAMHNSLYGGVYGWY